jgi:hypothetical protein
MLCLIIRKVGKIYIFMKNYMPQNCRMYSTYVEINSLGYFKKDYIDFGDKNDRKTATERYQCLETSQCKAETWRKSDEHISVEVITDDIRIPLQAI